ncbi:MAG: AMP-binding protein [Treponema sp.]|nr:AMP-binding protein [Treponema sp.]
MAAPLPHAFLEAFRGKAFAGEWPTLPELFAITTERYGSRQCFTVYDPDRISMTYAEAADRIGRVAALLVAEGVVPGDRVVVTGKNGPEWAVAWLAALHAGAIVVPIDAQLRKDETANLIKAADAIVAFVDEEKWDDVVSGPPGKAGSKAFGLAAIHSLSPKKPSYIYEAAAAAPIPRVARSENETAAILFTSGTTGTPKGVMLSHKNLVADCFLAQANLTILPTDIFYALLPLHHSYTMLAVFIEAISVGAEIVFGRSMATSRILHDLKEAKITMLLGVPLLFNKVLGGIMKGIREKGPIVSGILGFLMALSGLIKKTTGVNPGKALFGTVLDKASLRTIRICISGGGPLAPSVFRRYNQLGIDFIQGYGLTETSPILTLNPVEHYKETSVGKLIPGVEAKLLEMDSEGRGEIAVKGPMVMQGYFRAAAETAKVFTVDGWFKTGDVGWIDDENYVYLTGRAKNLIVTEGGKNVYPEEIEEAFQLFDEVDQILVRGFVPDASSAAEEIEAIIHPSDDFAKGKDWAAVAKRMEDIVAIVNEDLLPYQRIAKTTVVPEALEMTTTKKVKRFTVAQS